MLQMPTKQGATYEESWRITSFKDTRRTMVRNQYRYYWSITEIQQKRRYCGYSGLIFKNSSAQGNNKECIIRRYYKDLLQRNMETAWNSKNNS